jgi:hypothetical protein
MKAIILQIISHLAAVILGVAVAFFFLIPPGEVKVVEKKETVWKDKTVYRDYKTMTPDDLVKELYCYDKDEFKLDIKPLKENWFQISGSLCERSATRDVKMDYNCGSEGNWKFYLGVGLGAGAAAGIGYGIYKLVK